MLNAESLTQLAECLMREAIVTYPVAEWLTQLAEV